MEKISCDVIGDLLPLYCDDVCSEDSRRIVEEHLQTCPKCSELLQKIKTEYRLPTAGEQSEEEMMKDMASVWRRSVKKSFCRGVLITVCACLLLAGGHWALTRLILIPVPLDQIEATVENVSDDHVTIFLKTADGKKVLHISSEVTEDGKYYILLERGILAEDNGGEEAWTAEWSVPRTAAADSEDRIPVREIYCGTKDSNFLIWQAQ